jgi:hypothetical protein
MRARLKAGERAAFLHDRPTQGRLCDARRVGVWQTRHFAAADRKRAAHRWGKRGTSQIGLPIAERQRLSKQPATHEIFRLAGKHAEAPFANHASLIM